MFTDSTLVLLRSFQSIRGDINWIEMEVNANLPRESVVCEEVSVQLKRADTQESMNINLAWTNRPWRYIIIYTQEITTPSHQ